MKKHIILATLALNAALACHSQAGIAGKVTLKGEPKNLDTVIRTTADPRCMHEGELKTERWKISADKGLADVAVWVTKVPSDAVPKTQPPKPFMDQVGCQYVPHVVTTTPDLSVGIKNSDKTLHNVHALEYKTKAEKGKNLFNTASLAGTTLEKKFPAGISKVVCDVHPWMVAWVVCVDSLFSTVSGAGGTFSLPDGLPDGEYVVQARHSQFDKPLEQKVTVTGGNATLNFEFDVANAN